MSDDGKLLLIIMGVCVVIAFGQSFVVGDESRQRRIFWTCTAILVGAGFLLAEDDWRGGLAVAFSLLAVMVLHAYTRTRFVKIGGKVRTFGLEDNRPRPADTDEGSAIDPDYDPAPDSYGGYLTAPKMWWLVVFTMAISAGNIFAFVFSDGEWWVAAIGLAFLIFLSVIGGLGDASWDYKIARGQYLQFAIVTVMTAGLFAFLYLVAFQAARRWPVRREQSMEYRAHPRHRRQDE